MMMSGAWLQILLILAYLAIGLISVTFPIYAICVVYLPQEEKETIIQRKKRIQRLKTTIENLNRELSGKLKDAKHFEKIRKEISRYESEKKSLEERVFYLSVFGAVALPIVLLGGALLASCSGIYLFYEGLEVTTGLFILSSVILSGVALYTIFKTVLAVEIAVLRPARTVEFMVCYKSREKRLEIKLGEETRVSIGVGTIEEAVERFVARIYLPPEIELKKTISRVVTSVQPKGYAYVNHTMIMFERDFIPSRIYYGIDFTVLAKKIGKHKIPVRICAKAIYDYETKLILNVVK